MVWLVIHSGVVLHCIVENLLVVRSHHSNSILTNFTVTNLLSVNFLLELTESRENVMNNLHGRKVCVLNVNSIGKNHEDSPAQSDNS